MFSICSRFEDIAFCEWDECRGCHPRFGPDEREAAVAWLRGFQADDSQVAALRAAAHHAGFFPDLAGLSGQQVIEHLAWLISCRRLRVCGQGAVVDPSITQEILRAPGSAPSSEFAPVRAVRTPSRARASPPSGPEEGNLPGVDSPTLADALTKAASDGSPFVQVCRPPAAAP